MGARRELEAGIGALESAIDGIGWMALQFTAWGERDWGVM